MTHPVEEDQPMPPRGHQPHEVKAVDMVTEDEPAEEAPE
jgi:hypothetical protein